MRIVLDTNVVVSAIVFKKGRLTWLRDARQNGTVTPLIDKACADELLRVLAYPKFQLSQDEIETLLSSYLPYAEPVDTNSLDPNSLPLCRDPHDQKFLILAEAGNAEVLVTGDQVLLELSGQTSFEIEAPDSFKKRLKRLDTE